jgi:tRNA 2-thiocytidine biosynthesis protein TtcA
MDQLASLLHRPPPWLTRFAKLTGRGINRFGMIKEGDRIIIGTSGGKDSLALSLALSMRKKWVPIDYELKAIRIEWKEYPLSAKASTAIEDFYETLSIPIKTISATMFSPSFHGKFDCYLCSRNRKRLLFEEAERITANKVALGHHMDDIVETTLINLCFRGNFSTMMPVQEFFGGKLSIIRPLCMVKEKMVYKVAERLRLPVASLACPHKETNIRSKVKPVLQELLKIDSKTREHIFESPWNINEEYLPNILKE